MKRRRITYAQSNARSKKRPRWGIKQTLARASQWLSGGGDGEAAKRTTRSTALILVSDDNWSARRKKNERTREENQVVAIGEKSRELVYNDAAVHAARLVHGRVVDEVLGVEADGEHGRQRAPVLLPPAQDQVVVVNLQACAQSQHECAVRRM